MASSSSYLTDSMENVFRCSICGDEFEEPKLLPCLHRYCRNCLDGIIQASTEGTFKCAICKKICEVSTDGVNGFKTDFHMKSRLELIQLKTSFNNEDFKECVSCSKKSKMSVYCLKCQEFLCDQCGKFHESNRLFRDHKQHILKLENYRNQNLLEKLATVTLTPRCYLHSEQEAQLCCRSCGNLPVCMSCVCSNHKGHDILHDIDETSERERESLKVKLVDINQHRDKLYNLPKQIQKSIAKLKENERNKSKKIKLQYQQQLETIEAKLETAKAEREKNREKIKTMRQNEMNDKRRKFEEEMKQSEAKYDQNFNQTDQTHKQIIKELERKRERLDSYLKELTDEKEKKMKQNETELQNILEYSEQIIKRYENFTATASSILSSNDKWADVQCIPEVRAASELLLTELNNDFVEFESLSNFKTDNLRKAIVDIVIIDKRNDFKVVNAKYTTINGVTSLSNGIMVITGEYSGGYTHITEVNKDGQIQREYILKCANKEMRTTRYCCRLSEFKLVTVSQCEVGIYDARDGSYIPKNIEKTIPKYDQMTCVTSDPVEGHVIVGTSFSELYVFDDKLKYIKSIKLPNEARNPAGICVHGTMLLICSSQYPTQKAYALTLEGSSSHVMHEFTNPDLDGRSWLPSRVCTDKNGFIYMLWSTYNSSILVQYSQDGRQLLSQMPVDTTSTCTCMTISEQDGTESVVLTTNKIGVLHTYRLNVM